MQYLRAGAGARGWLWRPTQVESFGRASRVRLLHLSGRHSATGRILIAIRPFEPLAPFAAPDALHDVSAAEALRRVIDAKRDERIAFAVEAGDRLRGELHAWQLAAALAFERGHARVLLADPAGMGKTVSAGLAIAQCLDGASDRRCLVLAPGHLVRQWQQELHRRLAIESLAVEAGTAWRLQSAIPAGATIWRQSGCFVASIDFLKQPHVLKTLESIVWDLVVVDEAHLACGVSERRDAADAIARRSRRVLLLTATPSDGGDERLHSLLTLGAGKDTAPLVRLRHPRPSAEHSAGGPPWRPAVERRMWIAPGRSTAALHEAIDTYTRWVGRGPRGTTMSVTLLCSLLMKRALSSAHAARLSLERRLRVIDEPSMPLQPSLFEPEDDPGVIGAHTGLPIHQERRRLEDLLQLAQRAAAGDRRLETLARLLDRSTDSAIVFTCFRDTALHLAARLAPHAAIALVHGELPPATIERALAAFTGGRARVLVATDVAAQGLNLHERCRWVVHYDLPWRPPVLRQRVGRVDRLGQTRRPHATLLLDRTPLAQRFVARMADLTRRMLGDEPDTARRWQVLASEERRRLAARRQKPAASLSSRISGPVAVVETALLDGLGYCRERTVLITACAVPLALKRACAAADRRRRRLQRPLAMCSARRARRERHVLAAALETVQGKLRQDGLFDRRTLRAREHEGAVAARLRQDAHDQNARYAAEARIEAVETRCLANFLFP